MSLNLCGGYMIKKARPLSVALLAILTSTTFCESVSAVTPTPRIEVRLVGSFETVFDWQKDRCDPKETPDAPARAFRDWTGKVHLEAAQDTWREHVGLSLDTVVHRCQILFSSKYSNIPEKLTDLEWLGSSYTSDGRHIDVLIHNEYHARARTDICPSQKYTKCWSNSLTYAYSENGGETFIQYPAPQNFVAGLPYKYLHDPGFPIGYFQPSNVIKHDDYYYVLFTATAYLQQKAGTCLMRTNNLSDPSSWRAWDGENFSIKFMDPYVGAVSDPEKHVCIPLRSGLGIMGGLISDPKSRAFILVTKGGAAKAPRGSSIGIVALASYDLISWSDPVLLWADPSGTTSMADKMAIDQDPSVMDDSTSSRNIDVIGNKTYVYFVRVNPANRPYDRKLLRVQVEFCINHSLR
jgi:hypothetical protein